MRHVAIHNLNRPLASPLRVLYCRSFGCRLRGLTFRRRIPADGGIVLVQARDSRLDSAIHMLAVLTDLAIIWVNGEMAVVDTRLARQWRPLYLPRRSARYVIELAPQRLSEFRVGDRLRFEDTNGP